MAPHGLTLRRRSSRTSPPAVRGGEGAVAALLTLLWYLQHSEADAPGAGAGLAGVAAALALGVAVGQRHRPEVAWGTACVVYPAARWLLPSADDASMSVVPVLAGTYVLMASGKRGPTATVPAPRWCRWPVPWPSLSADIARRNAAFVRPSFVRPALVGGVGALATIALFVRNTPAAQSPAAPASYALGAPLEAAARIDQSGLLMGLALFATALLLGDTQRRRRLTTARWERERRRAAGRLPAQLRAARAEERQRIARELDLLVARQLGSVVVRAQAAEELVARDPARAADTFRDIAGTGQEALTAMRGIVRTMRSAPGAGTTHPWRRGR